MIKNKLTRGFSSGILAVSSFLVATSAHVTLFSGSAQACTHPYPRFPPILASVPLDGVANGGTAIITPALPFPTDVRLTCQAGVGASQPFPDFVIGENSFKFGIVDLDNPQSFQEITIPDPDPIGMGKQVPIIELRREPFLGFEFAAQPEAEVPFWAGFSGFMRPFTLSQLPVPRPNQHYAYAFTSFLPLDVFQGVAVQTAAGGSLAPGDPHPVKFSSVANVPEPTSTLGLLALGTLGAGATLKRKLKSSQSTEKETTKVG